MAMAPLLEDLPPIISDILILTQCCFSLLCSSYIPWDQGTLLEIISSCFYFVSPAPFHKSSGVMGPQSFLLKCFHLKIPECMDSSFPPSFL